MRVRVYAPLLIGLLALAACQRTPAVAANGPPVRAASTATLPHDAVVLAPSQAKALLGQCSRGTPQGAEGGWTPTADDILALEATLPRALLAAAHEPNDPDFGKAPTGWRRQYVGLVRGGRRLIYGNYFPSHDDLGDNWRSQPVVVCDGGHAFFGVEFDMATHRFTRIDFNGFA